MSKHTLTVLLWLGMSANAAAQSQALALDPERTTTETVTDNKLAIYQLMVRLFGNRQTANVYNGSITENGTGKFNDITGPALDSLRAMGISHIWYTGVVEHATTTDYTAYGIRRDDPDIVKGRAGSPYAIKDYYDVDPDLAVEVPRRMQEFEALVARTHQHGLKVLIDFVPNHVARTYHSDARPAGVRDFGEDDDTTRAFAPGNDFYYIPGKSFVAPVRVADGHFAESPARATGNNVFSEKPGINDWSETIKLNYGVDYQHGERTHFNPIPPVWRKMRDILLFWAGKQVDGFRCDVAEMVPVAFWNWVIPQVKQANPGIIFIAEAYNPKEYTKYLTEGKFDYLYDKVGLYDALKRLIRNDSAATVKDITHVWKMESRGFSSRMLRFLENHDEERIASAAFAGNPFYAKPAMVVAATLSSGPVMIYCGQESGEPGQGREGFGGDDGRTTIFDYWGMPAHQQWMNNGRFDGGGLTPERRQLRSFYARLLQVATTREALRKGRFYELGGQPGWTDRQYAYLRFTETERILIIANFERNRPLQTRIRLPEDIRRRFGTTPGPAVITNLLNNGSFTEKNLDQGIQVTVPPADAAVFLIH